MAGRADGVHARGGSVRSRRFRASRYRRSAGRADEPPATARHPRRRCSPDTARPCASGAPPADLPSRAGRRRPRSWCHRGEVRAGGCSTRAQPGIDGRYVGPRQANADRRSLARHRRCALRSSPPWASMMWRAMASPRPRPPCFLVARLSPWRNRSKTIRQKFWRDADAGVRELDERTVAVRLTGDRDRSAVGGELDRVREHVAEHLLQALRIPFGGR